MNPRKAMIIIALWIRLFPFERLKNAAESFFAED